MVELQVVVIGEGRLLVILLLLEESGSGASVGIPGICKIELLLGSPSHSLGGDLGVGLLVMLQKFVQRVEGDAAADVVFHEVGFHLGKI